MKGLTIVANWKANKTKTQCTTWLDEIKKFYDTSPKDFNVNKEIVVCPPFTLLSYIRDYIKKNNLPLQVGAQDISVFGRGSYTGEIPAALIYEFANWCIIGHSERRTNLHEDNELVKRKSEMLSSSLRPIFCIQNENTPVPEGMWCVAYEPVFAIGTGNPDTPESADSVGKTLKQKYSFVKYVLYGGSVTAENVHSFTSMQNIDGVLVGGASLDPIAFSRIITYA